MPLRHEGKALDPVGSFVAQSFAGDPRAGFQSQGQVGVAGTDKGLGRPIVAVDEP